ncbi:hypothetical protein ACFLZV_01425 [Candidatus Margulisiibacteriota bacterium]
MQKLQRQYEKTLLAYRKLGDKYLTKKQIKVHDEHYKALTQFAKLK